MKNFTSTIFILFFSILAFNINAQQLKPCGSMQGRSQWLKKYQAAPEMYSKSFDTTMYVAVTIHILGTDSGSGYYSLDALSQAFCTLNNDYLDANIQFYIKGDINYIDNTAWYDHDEILTGYEMMVANDIDSTLNFYFVADPAGNCGYSLPYASLAVAKSCAGPNDHTWAHEVGHTLSLPHPFLGWEGGVGYDNEIPHDFSDPAPEFVVYDYTLFQQDQLYTDTLIVDTSYVELVDRSNCQIAADGFCDTEADYLSYRWNCNGNGVSPNYQTDPSGVQFQSDGGLIMSYSDDACAYRFSNDQMLAMRANLRDEKSTTLNDQTPFLLISSTPQPLFPTGGEPAQFNQVEFTWSEVENADRYILQISRLPTFPGSVTSEYLVEGSSFVVTDLQQDKTYYWKVKALNRGSFCADYSEISQFETQEISSTNDLTHNFDLVVFPTLTQNELNWKITGSDFNLPANANVFDTNGRNVFDFNINTTRGQQILPPSLSAGIYWLKVEMAGTVLTEMIIVNK